MRESILSATSQATTSGAGIAARSPGGSAQPRRLGLALAVIAAAQLMVVLDSTIVNVALPHIQRALGFSDTNLEWVVNAYALAFGGLLLLGGRSGDLLGRRGRPGGRRDTHHLCVLALGDVRERADRRAGRGTGLAGAA